MHQETLIAIGSNQHSERGDALANCRAAVVELAAGPWRLRRVARFYKTPCFPAGAGPDFVNTAVVLACDLSPESILERLHVIEKSFGRERKQRWAPRVLDLDLVTSGQIVRPDPITLRNWVDLPPTAQANQAPDELVLPHPRLQERAFVLAPAMDILSDWRHPLTEKTVAQMWAELPSSERNAVVPLDARYGLVNASFSD